MWLGSNWIAQKQIFSSMKDLFDTAVIVISNVFVNEENITVASALPPNRENVQHDKLGDTPKPAEPSLFSFLI